MRFALLMFVALGSGMAHEAHADPSAELDVSDVDFGAIAPDTMVVQYATIANIGTSPRSPLIVTMAQITGGNGGLTFAGSPACVGQTICTLSLAITDTAALLPIQCDDSMGAQFGTLTLTSNSNDFNTSSSQITCVVAQQSAIGFATSALDFGHVDIRGEPVSQFAVLVNNTASSITLTTLIANPVDPTFTILTSVAGAVVPAHGTFPIQVKYAPTVEGGAGNEESLTVEWAPGDPSDQASINIMGVGIDRHAALISVPTFPDTTRNPGFSAPELPITIGDTGGAVLGLSNATITGGPTWSLVNPGPVDLPGGSPSMPSTFGYLVRFAPDAAGPAPPATFTVTTTDPANPTLTAQLTGNGVDRNASMSPAVIDLDLAGIDSTVHGSDPSRDVMLSITNNDPARTYAIAAIPVLGGEGAFQVVDISGSIKPGETRTFDVAFTPPHEGEFEATAVLYLDSDPTPQAEVTLRGTGTFVDVHGSGGCSTTGDDAGGVVVILVIALGLVRRRRAMILVMLGGGIASAETRNLDLSIFDPIPSTAAPTFAVQTADVGGEGAWAVTALATYANDPLVLTTPTNDNVTISDRTTLALGGAFAFGDRFEVAAHLPLYLQSGQDLSSGSMFGEPAVSATVIGDLEIGGKARLVQSRGPGGDLLAGIAIALALPTANDEQFGGSGRPQVRGLVLLDYTPPIAGGRVRLDANAGGVVRGTAYYDDIVQGNGIDWAGGVTIRAHRDLAIAAELFGELVPGGLDEPMGQPRVLDTAEALVGVHYQAFAWVNIGVAAGRGLTTELGSPALRGVVTLTFAPSARVTTDRVDALADDDHDGVPNSVDRCPNQPEDRDGFQDEDGCPDPDNDNDGIPDVLDKCPNEPEDKDGFQDADGCPDPDNDRDGIPDRIDKCPNEPETINGFQDEDGCPDQGVGLVKIGSDRLEVGEDVKFAATGKIDPASFNVMGQIGATLRAHLEVSKIRIVAHGTHATTIRDWLVQYGISRDRLEPTTRDASDDHVDWLIVEKL